MKRIFGISLPLLLIACGGETVVETDLPSPTEDTISEPFEIVEAEIEAPEHHCEYNFLSLLDTEFDQNTKVEAIGVYDSTWVVGEESVYGFNVKMWKVNEMVIGFMNHYYGSPEPYQSGPIVSGSLNNENELVFSAYLKLSKGYNDWSDSDAKILTFKGVYTDELLSGALTNYNCVTKDTDIDMARTLGLMKSDIWGDLPEFATIQEWKKAYEYELNMNP